MIVPIIVKWKSIFFLLVVVMWKYIWHLWIKALSLHSYWLLLNEVIKLDVHWIDWNLDINTFSHTVFATAISKLSITFHSVIIITSSTSDFSLHLIRYAYRIKYQMLSAEYSARKLSIERMHLYDLGLALIFPFKNPNALLKH